MTTDLSDADALSADPSRSPSRKQKKNAANNRRDNDFNSDWLDDSSSKDRAPSPNDAMASLADDLRGAAKSTVDAVKQQASAIVDEVGHELGKTTEEQMGRGADAIRGFARAINAAGGELEDQSPALANAINDWAAKVETFSQGLGRRQLNELVDAATGIAKNQPAAFFGAAVATGFALARFLKSSAKHQGTSRGNDPMVSGRRTMGADNARH